MINEFFNLKLKKRSVSSEQRAFYLDSLNAERYANSGSTIMVARLEFINDSK
jgi:hypothetical protein